MLALLAAVPAAVAALVLLPAGLGAMRSESTTPLPFALGSLILVLLGALASLVLVVRHDDLGGTTFATARLDLFWTAALLAVLGGAVYWWPKLFGRMLDARLTNLSAVRAARVGGAARRRACGRRLERPGEPYAASRSTTQATASLVASIGVAGIVAGLALFGLAKLGSRRGRRVGNDPWGGDTLEWYAASPPAPGQLRDRCRRSRASARSTTSAVRCGSRVRSDAVAPGPILRLTALGGALGAGVVVASAALDLGRTHWAAALVALPLLVAVLVIGDRRVPVARPAAASSRSSRWSARSRPAESSRGRTRHAGRSSSTSERPGSRSPRRSSTVAMSFRASSVPIGPLARLRDAHEAADHDASSS